MMQVLEIRKQSINKLNFTYYRIIIIIINNNNNDASIRNKKTIHK